MTSARGEFWKFSPPAPHAHSPSPSRFYIPEKDEHGKIIAYIECWNHKIKNVSCVLVRPASPHSLSSPPQVTHHIQSDQNFENALFDSELLLQAAQNLSDDERVVEDVLRSHVDKQNSDAAHYMLSSPALVGELRAMDTPKADRQVTVLEIVADAACALDCSGVSEEDRLKAIFLLSTMLRSIVSADRTWSTEGLPGHILGLPRQLFLALASTPDACSQFFLERTWVHWRAFTSNCIENVNSITKRTCGRYAAGILALRHRSAHTLHMVTTMGSSIGVRTVSKKLSYSMEMSTVEERQAAVATGECPLAISNFSKPGPAGTREAYLAKLKSGAKHASKSRATV